MGSLLRTSKKHKKSRRLGEPEVMAREEYGELEVDVKIEMIRSLIPLGLMHVHELLDDEVKVLAGERYARKDELERGRRHGTNPVLFFTLNREDFSFVIHLDRQPRTSRRREAQTGSRARSGSRSERTLDAVEHSRTLMEWWPFLIFHRGGLRIKVINNTLAR